MENDDFNRVLYQGDCSSIQTKDSERFLVLGSGLVEEEAILPFPKEDGLSKTVDARSVEASDYLKQFPRLYEEPRNDN